MKNLLFLALVACLGFVACDTPSPAASDTSDTSTTNMQTAPDTLRSNTDTSGSGTQRSDTMRRDSSFPG
jgi:hypothetical protein